MNPDFNDLIGTPFHEDGYGPDTYSCYGLAVEIFKRYDINIPRVNISVCACKETSQKEIEKNIFKYWERVNKLEIPAVLVIKATNPEYADHIGVYIGEGKFIHITINRSVVIDRYTNWEKKVIGFYRYVGSKK